MESDREESLSSDSSANLLSCTGSSSSDGEANSPTAKRQRMAREELPGGGDATSANGDDEMVDAEEMTKRLERAKDEYKRLLEEAKAEEERVGEMKRTRADTDSTLKRLKEEEKVAEKEIDRVKKSIDRRRELLADGKNELVEMTMLEDEQQENMAEAQHKFEEQEELLNEKCERIKSNQHKIDENDDKLREQERKLADLQNTLTEKSALVLQKEQQIQQHQQRLDFLEENLAMIHQRVVARESKPTLIATFYDELSYPHNYSAPDDGVHLYGHYMVTKSSPLAEAKAIFTYLQDKDDDIDGIVQVWLRYLDGGMGAVLTQFQSNDKCSDAAEHGIRSIGGGRIIFQRLAKGNLCTIDPNGGKILKCGFPPGLPEDEAEFIVHKFSNSRHLHNTITGVSTVFFATIADLQYMVEVLQGLNLAGYPLALHQRKN